MALTASELGHTGFHASYNGLGEALVAHAATSQTIVKTYPWLWPVAHRSAAGDAELELRVGGTPRGAAVGLDAFFFVTSVQNVSWSAVAAGDTPARAVRYGLVALHRTFGRTQVEALSPERAAALAFVQRYALTPGISICAQPADAVVMFLQNCVWRKVGPTEMI